MNLYFEKCGSGRPLILLHGNGENCTIFRKAVEVLKSEFTVYAVDTRGHGKSPRVQVYHYEDMAEDVYQLIQAEHLEKPIVYGFSDGGILALLLAIRHRDLLSMAIASGVNANPEGVKPGWLKVFKAIYQVNRSPLFALMLTEPNITAEMLQDIRIPVTIFGADRDMIQKEHMEEIAMLIPKGVYREVRHANHSSYIVNSDRIAHLILEEVKTRL